MEWDIIHSYTRAEAIEDGVLVDVTPLGVTRGHFKVAVAMTATLWWLVDASAQLPGRTYAETLHDMYVAAKEASRLAQLASGESASLVTFAVDIPGNGMTHAKVHAGPGDHGELVITFMLIDED